jgi:hypothetical protein
MTCGHFGGSTFNLIIKMINIIDRQYFTDINEFEFRLDSHNKLVGTGSFGVVRLALHKGTNRMYAIKIVYFSVT